MGCFLSRREEAVLPVHHPHRELLEQKTRLRHGIPERERNEGMDNSLQGELASTLTKLLS